MAWMALVPGCGSAKLPPMRSLFLIGDSISVDYGPFLAAAIAPWFSYARKSGEDLARANLDVAAGANGGDSRAVLAYLRARAAAGGFRPEVLLVNAGLHDVKTTAAGLQVSLAEYRTNLAGIAALAKELGSRLVWVRTTHLDDRIHNAKTGLGFTRHQADVDACNAAADEVLAALPRIDLHGFSRTFTDPFRDHVHFREGLPAQQAAFLAGALTQL
ncbi:hypothetical protein LBMAG53_02580 [Planctomycetota bacterium]|nr:hypothetical protein LBMAG53_02580 [Planctomycetota bacterium]